ncbi:cytochrome P450 [Daldinia sp. FL1419]|nr:cytochrome P450 [Daldinia sp. FL1419]
MAAPHSEGRSGFVHLSNLLEINLKGSLRLSLSTLLVVFSLYIYLILKKKSKTEKLLIDEFGCKPVIPRVPYKWPLALDLILRQYKVFFSDHTFEQLTDYFNIAGTGRVEFFGVTGYFTSDPNNIETILSTRFEDYGLGSRRLASAPLLGEGIFSQDGPAWKHSRELIKRQFMRIQKQTIGVFAPHAEKLVIGLDKGSVGAVVDLKPFLFEYTLSTTTELLFGEPHDSLSEEEQEAVRSNFDYAATGMGIRVRLADLAVLYNPPKFKRACKSVQDWATFFAGKALRYRDEFGEEKASEKYSFIIDLWKEMRDEQLVRDQLLHILVAGRDSTAALLSWTFFHLVRNPESLDRLKQEVSSVPQGSDITRDQIQKLPFLRCCLNEILRLYPSLPMNIRFANKATVLPRGGGPDGLSPVMLPKGTGIAWSVYHLHRSESIYGTDSREFRPQRWESGELLKTARIGAGYIDFNGGPRTCLGKDFALMEASYAIVRILHAFPGIRLAPGEPNEPVGVERHTYTIGIFPTDGVKVSLV